MDPSKPLAEALVIKNGKIVAVGTNEEIHNEMPFGADIIDAGGNSVFPGFFDTHVHITSMGQSMSSLRLEKARSKRELINLLISGESNIGERQWLYGTGYDESDYPEKMLPDMSELDELFGSRPVLLERTDCHQVLVNSAAFNALGLDPNEDGVVIDSDGRPTGVVKDPANGKAHRVFSEELLTDEMRKAFIRNAANEILKMGTTSISALEGGELFSDKDCDALLSIKDSLPLNIRMYHQTLDVSKVVAEGQKQIGGCIVLDGSLGSHTAALFEDYSDMKGNKGNLYYSQRDIDDFVMEANEKGLQVSMHCIGDRAIERLLKAYEKALDKNPRPNHRHRFEHFSLASDDQAERALSLGCCLAMQPSYIKGEKMFNTRLGENRVKMCLRFKDFLNMGFKVGGGSDAPVTPVNPFSGISFAMEHFLPWERLNFWEGVRLFTTDAAYLTFEEATRGSIVPGKWGDIAICDRNVMKMDLHKSDELRNIEFNYTITEGEIRYSKLNKK